MDKIYECIGLLSSMVSSGENHSERSRQAIADAKQTYEDLKTEKEKLERIQPQIESIIAEFGEQPELCFSIIDEYFNGKPEIIY